jgi:hypothetical protein
MDELVGETGRACVPGCVVSGGEPEDPRGDPLPGDDVAALDEEDVGVVVVVLGDVVLVAGGEELPDGVDERLDGVDDSVGGVVLVGVVGVDEPVAGVVLGIGDGVVVVGVVGVDESVIGTVGDVVVPDGVVGGVGGVESASGGGLVAGADTTEEGFSAAVGASRASEFAWATPSTVATTAVATGDAAEALASTVAPRARTTPKAAPTSRH